MSVVSQAEPSNPWTPEQLTAYLRFQLSQMRTQNRHHAFEDLCRDFARQNILTNILPATGPVAGGGDQGRDFETFHTYLANNLGSTGHFVGIAPEETVVFTCTLQVGDIKSKVLGDVASICGQGAPVSRIFSFVEVDVPTSKRHDLIERVSREYRVSLEIIDGTALAEILTQKSNVWIAIQYLNVPTSHIPSQVSGPDWYESEKSRLQTSGNTSHTYGDLENLRTCMRYARGNRELRPDLEFWIKHASPFLSQSFPQDMQDIASYEIVVARLRGQGNMTAADELARRFLKRSLSYSEPSKLENAAVLLMYVQGAWLHGSTRIGKQWIVDYLGRLLQQVNSLITSENDSGRLCELLDTKATLLCSTDLTAIPGENPPSGRYLPVPPLPHSRLVDLLSQGEIALREDVSLLSAEEALQTWLELLKILPRAPLFPVTPLVDHISIRAVYFVHLQGWSSLTRQLDEQVERQAGLSARAESAWKRARSLLDAGRPLAAIPDLELARKNWLTGDNFEKSVVALGTTAEAFKSLGLFYAAKHYFLAAGALASSRDIMAPTTPASLLDAAICDFLAGNWCSFLALLGPGLNSHGEVRGDAENVERWNDFKAALGCLTYVRETSRIIASPEINAYMERSLGLEAPVFEDVNSGPSISETDASSMEQALHADLGQPAFADSGPFRTITWKCQGIYWKVRCKNRRIDVLAAERFAAAAQEICTLFSDVDLVLCPSSVLVEISTVPSLAGEPAQVEPRWLKPTSKGEKRWAIKLTRDEGPYAYDYHAAHAELAGNILAVLSEVSLLPDEKLNEAITKAVTRESLSRIMPHIRYDRAASFIDDESFNGAARRGIRPWGKAGFSEPMVDADILEVNEAGPGYSDIEAEIRCINRYKGFARMLPHTLARLNQESAFQQAVAQLRGKGWKDWHILQALTNLVVNYRNKFTQETIGQATPELVFADEDPSWEAIPPEMVTLDALKESLEFSSAATLRTWGLMPRSPMRPDQFMSLLERRYNYWSADAPHDNPFSGE
ncbi:hypothetical protein OG243_13690 [Streptomyces sp. NBC_01318]|uniref:hypothetical protein n=1 Tax=Streptomyces sp. NBC_01318 TaxID=2903823 RepID=UPI002E108522|nr:hypothetical protein OG243_13690 [Streptomyces sp. NBC_01318]